MRSPTLQDLIARGALPKDEPFVNAIENACLQQSSFLSIWNLHHRRIEMITPSCQTMTGYEPHEFISGGTEFIFSITVTDSIPSIIQAQTKYITQAKKPGFDPRSVVIHEYPFDIRLSLGYTRRLISLAVILTYTKHADMEYGVAMIAENDPDISNACRSLLTTIKELHNKIHQHIPIIRNIPNPVGNGKDQSGKILTPREVDILRHLANGLTSAQIAKALFIEENTVETHRKNILSKFEAKNIAELIKKASKVYWLE